MDKLIRRDAFLALVREYLEENPEVVGEMWQAVSAGIAAGVKAQKRKSCDMEIAVWELLMSPTGQRAQRTAVGAAKRWMHKATIGRPAWDKVFQRIGHLAPDDDSERRNK